MGLARAGRGGVRHNTAVMCGHLDHSLLIVGHVGDHVLKRMDERMNERMTGPDDAVVMQLANGLVGTGFASRYRLKWVGVWPLHPLLSH